MPDAQGRPTALTDMGEASDYDYPMHAHISEDETEITITGFLLEGRDITKLHESMRDAIKQLRLDRPTPTDRRPGGNMVATSRECRLTITIRRAHIWSREDEEKWRPG